MRKLLEFSDMPLVTSECWTYYKVSIIQTLRGFENWLITHMKLFLDNNGNALFGEDGELYPLSYYCDILNIEDGNILKIKKNDITDFIIRCINDNKYVLIDINFRRFFDQADNAFRLHETLIYGYDSDKQEFITSVLTNNTFKRVNLGFSEVEQAYDDVYRYYKTERKTLFDRKYWFLGLTLFSFNRDYKNVNEEYDLLRRLMWEVSGNVYKKCSNNGTNEYMYFTGAAILKKLCDMFAVIISEEKHSSDWIQQCGKVCLKAFEREKILRVIIKYYFDKNNCEKNSINDKENVITDLNHCCDLLEKCVLLLYKYGYTSNDKILQRVKNFLTELQDVEKRALENCISIIQENWIA